MPTPDLPDLDELALQLVQARHRGADLRRRLEKAEERHAQFPTEHTLRTLDELKEEDEALKAEITGLEEQLRPLLRRPEPG
jgi:predicted  nucleic acid-binding Zn-ribbon protein